MLPTSVSQLAPDLNLHLSPHDSPPSRAEAAAAPPPSQPSKCNPRTCPWWPYSSSKDFRANTALILTILFCALLFALALNAAIRYILRQHRRPRRDQDIEAGAVEQKPSDCSDPVDLEAIPTSVFSPGMKLGGAEAECAICLTELVEGDVIRVLDGCSHGFHVQCIQQWLVSHSSCPTCRANCTPRPASIDDQSCHTENAAEG